MGDYNTDKNQPILPWVNHFYYVVFPGLKRVTYVEDESIQKLGIDKILRFGAKRISITVDEKIREKSYGDILLEEYSNWQLRTPGWLMKGAACDYISYIIRPEKLIYLISYTELKSLWDRMYPVWLSKYGRRFGKTGSYSGGILYQTSNIPVRLNDIRIKFTNDPRLSTYIPDKIAPH